MWTNVGAYMRLRRVMFLALMAAASSLRNAATSSATSFCAFSLRMAGGWASAGAIGSDIDAAATASSATRIDTVRMAHTFPMIS